MVGFDVECYYTDCVVIVCFCCWWLLLLLVNYVFSCLVDFVWVWLVRFWLCVNCCLLFCCCLLRLI